MIKLRMTSAGLLDLRFAHSPLLAVINSYLLLQGFKGNPALYDVWIDATRRALAGTELPYLQSLLCHSRYIPDFLTPTPTAQQPSFEDELAQLMKTPSQYIRDDVQYLTELDGTSPIRQLMLSYPQEALVCIVDELRLYWKRALEPHWSQISTILEGDMLHRGRVLALEGTSALLSTLAPQIEFDDVTGEIRLHRDCPLKVHELQDQGLQLVPAMFYDATEVMWMVNPHYRPFVMYSARGAGQWKQSVPESNHSLELALGSGRARVLVALHTPRTTNELARLLGLYASGVSQHLSRLHQAGLVESHRVSRRVYYSLTQRGEQLLAIFS